MRNRWRKFQLNCSNYIALMREIIFVNILWLFNTHIHTRKHHPNNTWFSQNKSVQPSSAIENWCFSYSVNETKLFLKHWVARICSVKGFLCQVLGKRKFQVFSIYIINKMETLVFRVKFSFYLDIFSEKPHAHELFLNLNFDFS